MGIIPRAGLPHKGRGTVSEVCYLLHFSDRLGNPENRHAMAQHYIGTATDLDARLAAHRAGAGARITAAAAARGIAFAVVRTWPGGRDLERRLKNRKEAPRLCPVCKGTGRAPAPPTVD